MGVSIWEVGLILLVALLVVNPKHLPKAAANAGRWLRYFRNLYLATAADIKQNIAAIEQEGSKDD